MLQTSRQRISFALIKNEKLFNLLLDLGLVDCYEHTEDESPYTWWDYRGGAFHRDIGYRIDLLLASKSHKSRLKNYEVHKRNKAQILVSKSSLKLLTMHQ
jgi:exonuclease III